MVLLSNVQQPGLMYSVLLRIVSGTAKALLQVAITY